MMLIWCLCQIKVMKEVSYQGKECGYQSKFCTHIFLCKFTNFNLACLAGFYAFQSDCEAIALKIFPSYLKLVQKILNLYRLEPVWHKLEQFETVYATRIANLQALLCPCIIKAGSHGAWSLDDYFFLPFLLGSAQMQMPAPAVETTAAAATSGGANTGAGDEANTSGASASAGAGALELPRRGLKLGQSQSRRQKARGVLPCSCIFDQEMLEGMSNQ
jgi:hypothetical protein